MNLSIRSRFFVLLFVLVSFAGYSQSCLTISAGSNTTICQGNCANLSAVLSQSVQATTAYTVSSVAHAPLPYTGGTNAFAFATDDIWSQPINIGFNFCYFGNTFTQCLVGSNGQITFNTALAGQPNTFTITTAIPSTVNVPGNTICGPFRDIDPSQGGVVRTYVTGTAPCRRFVAYWSGVPHWGNGCIGVPTTTFQIVLNETTNDIQVFINNHTACNSNSGGAGIVGVQNANGTIGTAAPARNFPGAWTAVNEGWLFRPNGASATAITWSGPTGIVGTGLTATVCPTANSTYTSSMVVTQCNGTTNTFTSTVQVSVTPVPTITAGSSITSVCLGSPVQLNASGASTYTWNPGALTGGTVTVNPTVTTTYTVTGTGPGSCTNSAQVTVTVLPGPTLTISNTSPSVCAGFSSTLSASGGLTYTWQPVGSNASTVVVTPVTTTIYTLSGTDLAGCTASVTTTVSVVSPPLVSIAANPNPLCSGSSATLLASGASSYTWSTGATTASVVVSPTVTTVFTVTGSAGGGCTATASSTVTVLPLFPVVINPATATVCPNTSVNLFASAAAINYTWLPVNLFTPTIAVTPTATTIYTVIASNGTCTNSATSTITTLSAPVLNPVASPTAICSGNSSTLTASGASSYTWTPGGFNTASVMVTPTVTTTYSVSGTNTLGCVSTETVDIVVNANPVISTAGTSTAICTGGTATLNATGANSYTWNPGNIPLSSVVVSPGTTTIYTVTGETNGCTGTETVTVNVNPTPTVNASASSATICAGTTTTLSATGALSYTWNPGAFTGTQVAVNPTVTTTYTVTGENGANCSSTATIAITVNPLPVVSATSTPAALCSSGNVTLTGSGANTYTWNPGNLNGNLVTTSVTSSTSFTVNATSLSGCTNSAVVTVTVDTPPVINASASPSFICSGGTATLTATGSSGFTWTPGVFTGTSVIVTPTTTTVYTVVAVNGACSSSVTVPVTVNPLPVLIASSSPTSVCSGNSATLTASGATSYTWNPGALVGSSVSVTPATSTIYSVTGTNGTGCTSSATVALFVQPTPTILTSASPTAICPGNSTTLTAVGAPSFTWNPGGLTGTSVVVSPTVSTTYTVTGANGLCTTSSTLNVIVNPQPLLLASVSPTAICNGATATLSANGAVTYTWLPGALNDASVAVNPTVSTLYTVTGTSSLGCTGSSTVNLVVNSNPLISASASPTAICSGATTTLSATGALTYTWLPGGLNGASVTATPSTSTLFSVVATSSLGCTGNGTVAVFVTPTPSINASASPTPVCSGNSVTLTAVGATSFTWNPGGINSSVAVVTPSSTTNYTVTGANGVCTRTVAVPVFVVPNPNVLVSASPSVICEGSTTTLTASGALTYTWLPGAQNGSVISTSLTASTVFTVSGTNVNGCVGNNTVAVTVNALPVLTLAATPGNSICAGSTVTLTANGAASYTWQPLGLTNATVTDTPSSTQTYTATGESLTGCVGAETITVTVVPLPSLTISPSSSTICSGSSVTLTATGATAYTWTPGAITGSVLTDTPIATTVYSLTGEDGGCESVQTITITVDPNPNVSISASPSVICEGSTTTLTASGALTYTWLPGAQNGSVISTSLTASTVFTVSGTNVNGCVGNNTVAVTVNALPVLTLAATPGNSICAGSTVTLTANGAASYTWQPLGLTNATVTDTPTSTQTYTVTGESLTGCVGTETITVTVVPLPSLTISPSSSTICSGSSVTLTATGATAYTWTPGAITGSVLTDTPTATTVYSLTGEDGGCESVQTITITVDPGPIVTAAASSTDVCSGSNVTLTATGAGTYTWNPGGISGTTVVLSPTVTTSYSLQGNSATGCISNVDVITVSVTPLPSVTIAATSTAVCAGTSVSLTASGASSYTWLPGGNTATVEVVTPTVTSSYTLTGENGLCSNQSIITISVQPSASVTVVSSSGTAAICANTTVTLTAGGASTYTWSPGGVTGSTLTVTPSVTTTYTINADNGTGCTGQTLTTVSVTPAPSLTITAPSLTICADASTTLNVSGATSYTWIPFGITISSLPVSPTVTTTYSVIGSNGTCTTQATETVVVNALPVLTVTATPSLICGGSSSTLTVSGAQTYTWQPLGLSGSSVVVTPTVVTLYTVSGTDGNGCAGSGTVQVSTGTAPVVVASNDGPISCTLAAVNLSATTIASNVNFNWSGPGSYSSSVQNPSGISIPGDYTVTVTDILSGCTGTAVTTVTIDPSVPQLTVASSGSLTCNTLTVSLAAVTNVTNAAFSWNGPASFTASTASITISAGGVYSLTVINLDNSCRSSTVVSVSGYTAIPVTATITPASCSGTLANNDGSIQLNGFSPTDHYDLVTGGTYTGTATYTSATGIPVGGIITNTLANPSTTVAYTVRVFDSNGCIADITLTLTPSYCLPPNLDFGLAKAVSTPSLQTNGSYNVTYSVVAQNATSGVLNNVVLLEALNTTFPAPSTFSIITPPVLTNTNSGLALNPAFDGSVQVALTLPTSSMSPISKDTIVFQLNIVPNGVFGPFNNSVTGSVLSGTNIIKDTSQTGMIPDSDSDFDFSDNNQPTVLVLDPFRFFGITKEGSVGDRLTDGTYDVTYTITVHNKGNDTLRNVTVKDSLYQAAVKLPANYSLKSGPITSGFLIANSAFNGRSDINLLLPASSKIAPFSTERVIFTINVVPDTVTIYRNSAFGSALGSGNIAVSDTSNAGNNPDTNNNGIWNESVDNQPTVLVIKPSDLFIPQAFTPEGDGKNDFFVIKGLKSGVDNSLTVYNRWGNKVYEKPNYDNTWDGTPNVSGTLGGQKLPQGTYYYIFEIKDGTKPITGFVVIQY